MSKAVTQDSGTNYWPEAVQAFQELINKEYFCLDIKSPTAIDRELDKTKTLFVNNLSSERSWK